ncbi:CubicO group peptidase (beta-lactamase class C family) [Neolewinella xylanilytica]|uniref:CubicO group peptidase (Beta-lactamase class C family) n=1 Tax=Neolewinella xylanilytica TaxID=1514080 RepID=A0A2S6I5T3_9BACT|nr:serine hydrolase domain-containing protein [Neolewinella xylanilytica]PPK86471.1 CubicO group peptidase (beta-lactamase class C family) [Neolewinella xylanilytica]
MLRLLLLCFPVALIGQPNTFPTGWQDSLRTLLQADVPEGGPGGALGVVHRGEVIFEAYVGLADLETEAPIGPATRFNVASNAKQFTALCVLRLAEEGKLDLQDDIRRYLPDVLPGIDSAIRIEHLVTHTSGIRDVYNLWSLQGITWWKETLSNEDAYQLLLKQTDLNFDPGSHYLYSNSNYLLLTKLVEAITGVSFTNYADRLFSDLGMRQTTFLADHRLPVPQLARPYFNFDTWQTYEWLSDLHGDGALFTTLGDQLHYEQLRTRPDAVDSTLARAVIRSQGLPWPNPGAYGFGVEYGDYRGQPISFHNGSTGAWKASVLRFPEFDLAIVVTNNSGKFFSYDLARDVADVLLAGILKRERYPSVPEPNFHPDANVAPVGIYGATEGYAIRIEAENGDTLILHRYGRSDIRVEPVDEGIYREITDTTFYQTFDRGPDGSDRITLYHPIHAPYSLSKADPPVEETTIPGADVSGSFHNTETGVELTVSFGPGDRTMVLGGDSLVVEPFTERMWVTRGYTFLTSTEHDRPVLYLFDDRLRWVRFDQK